MSWNPFRRHRPTGRHSRPVYPSVPGAAATLVAVAAAAAGGSAPDPRPARRAPVDLPAPVSPVTGAVGLGFADGRSVELSQDDPRAVGLRAAAAALLDPAPR